MFLYFSYENNLPIFNDYFVENFHSSIRSHTVESSNALQIIQKAKIIDAERNINSFKESFINSRNPTISAHAHTYLIIHRAVTVMDLIA
ncbi:hypothetical protein RhiirA1_466935 [Rhizophagus irregularis]|uniref:Uncharacterized protein n=1 Tax=Rhizophagus irregularis TaxID=588596 RepID=A0A2N0RCY5_9GLOM|nr:hypothetical protein RhiirA1_466935 [Rhizophagus irregularis]GET50520.1 hypothetical protein GLOIN_2v1789879 [Rhizophagus irregularis DAOM 181602=DAOM 197198]